MAFITATLNLLSTIITLMGAGVGVWGVVNLLEGYGGDNAAAKSQGIKQFAAGIGIVLIAQVLIPQLSTLFTI